MDVPISSSWFWLPEGETPAGTYRLVFHLWDADLMEEVELVKRISNSFTLLFAPVEGE